MAINESTLAALDAVVDCMGEADALVNAFMSLDAELRDPPPVLAVFYRHVWRLRDRVGDLELHMRRHVLPLLDDFSQLHAPGGSGK